MKRTLMWTMAATLLAVGAAGCGEKDQTTSYKDGKYRGKTDTRPWDNAPSQTSAGGWTKGDHASWEDQLRSRSINSQNENRRIGH